MAFEKDGKEVTPLHLVIPERIHNWLIKFNEDIARVLDGVHVVKSQVGACKMYIESIAVLFSTVVIAGQ